MTEEPIFNPSDTVQYLAKARKVRPEELRLPEHLLITYTPREFQFGRTLIKGEPAEWWPYESRLQVGKFNNQEIAISHSFVGAPGAVMMLEELIAHGSRTIIEAGLSGGIDPALQPGDICLLTQAFSDEGTSRHYHPRKRTFKPSQQLTSILDKTLKENRLKFRHCAAWTTDAPYRETRSKVARFQSKGASLVNMESSSIFALANFRRVRAASIQVVSDIVVKDGWKPAFRHKRVLENRQAMVKIAAEALTRA